MGLSAVQHLGTKDVQLTGSNVRLDCGETVSQMLLSPSPTASERSVRIIPRYSAYALRLSAGFTPGVFAQLELGRAPGAE